jgi:hypothetical protein
MRISVAGATGVIGVRLIPLLVGAGHTVTGMTRAPDKTREIEAFGADAVVCDVSDVAALEGAMTAARPAVVMNALSDLPDDHDDAAASGSANARIRREGSRGPMKAAAAARVRRTIALSVAWPLGGDEGHAVEEMETAVLDGGGVVIRCGRLYGPGPWYAGSRSRRGSMSTTRHEGASSRWRRQKARSSSPTTIEGVGSSPAPTLRSPRPRGP